MPIKGLSNRGEAFAQIGQIRKGAQVPVKGKPGKTRPIDLEYFRVVFDEEEQEAAAIFEQAYPQEPKAINVFLPFDEVDKCFDAYLEAYVASRLVARSDGERLLYLIDPITGEVKVRDGEPYEPVTDGQRFGEEPISFYKKQDGSKEAIYLEHNGRLKVVIPELKRLAYMLVITGSINDIANLDEQLWGYKKANGGKLTGIPFILRRRKKDISKKMPGGKRTRGPSWLLSIEPNPQWVEAKLLEMQARAAPQIPMDDFAGFLPPLTNGGDPEVITVEATVVEEPAANQDKPPMSGQFGSMLKWDQYPRPVSPKDWAKYYNAATQWISREEARAYLVEYKDAQVAFDKVGKMVAGLEEEPESKAMPREAAEEPAGIDPNDLVGPDFVFDPESGQFVPTNGGPIDEPA